MGSQESTVAAAVALFIETGAPVTTSEVAARAGVSQSVARGHLQAAFKVDRGWIRIAPCKTAREFAASAAYPDMGTRSAMVPAWHVPAAHLCAIIRAAREVPHA